MAVSYYEVLGAAPGASVEDLRRAYRAAVKAAHPDTGGTAESFRAVQDAWAVLRDPSSRETYDVRTAAAEGAGARVNGSAGPRRQPPPARPAGPPPRPTPAPPASAPDPAAPRGAEPKADEPEQAPAGAGPDPEERARRRARILLGVVITVAGVSGLLAGAIVFAMFGRFGAVAAGLYLLLVAAAVVQLRQGNGEVTGLLRTLRKACWVVVALWVGLAAVAWAGERAWVPPALYATVFASFGAAIEWLTRAPREQ